VLDMCMLSNIWYEQNYVNIQWISAVVNYKTNLSRNGSVLFTTPQKARYTECLKTSFCFKNYINIHILPYNLRKIFMKFQTSNHQQGDGTIFLSMKDFVNGVTRDILLMSYIIFLDVKS
jgi:hypothetical protein